MALISWKEFIAAQESSPATRSKTASALGLGPDVADVFGHATPPPWQTERLLKKLRKEKPKKDNKEDGNEPIEEKRDMKPNYNFDRLVRKAVVASDEIDKEIDKADKEADRLDKEKEKKDKKEKRSQIGPRPTKPEKADSEDDGSHDVDHTPNPGAKKIDPRKEKVKSQQGEVDELTEEDAWLRLLGDTSFDPH